MTFGTPTRESVAALDRPRDELRRQCESFLMEKRAAGVEELSGPDETRFRAMTPISPPSPTA